MRPIDALDPTPRSSERVAERRAFVELKRTFLGAVERLDDAEALRLKDALRRAEEPEDLWELRGPVFAALRADPVNGPRLRHELRRCLAAVFPDTFWSYSDLTPL
jgi:hypothetical protein